MPPIGMLLGGVDFAQLKIVLKEAVGGDPATEVAIRWGEFLNAIIAFIHQRPAAAETIALATITRLMEETGARVHLCRLSTRGAVAQVRAAKKARLPLTCDYCQVLVAVVSAWV